MLELKHISYRVSTPEGEMDIIKDISITIPDHRLMVFTGPNGGGKTTLAKIIMGLVQPTSGQIFYNGEDITGLSITEQARVRPPETGFALEGTRLSEVYLPRTAAPAEEL